MIKWVFVANIARFPCMKAIKIRKKVNACAFLRTFPRRCEIFLLRHGRGGRACRQGGESNAGTFGENKGTFCGKWGGKGEKPRAFCTDLGRRAHGLGEMARGEGALVGCSGGQEWAHRGRKGARPWRNGAMRRRVGGAQGRREWAHRGRKGAGGGGARNNAYLCGRLTDFFLLHRTLFL